MTELACMVDEYVDSRGVKRTWIMSQLGLSQPYYNKLINKKNFTVKDANRILSVLNACIQVEYNIVSNHNQSTDSHFNSNRQNT